MTTRIVNIPFGLFNALTCDWDIDWRGQYVGGTDGIDQIHFNKLPRWVGSPQIALHNEEIRRFRAIRAYAQGMAGVWRIPLIDRDNLEETYPDGVPWDTGEPWSNELGWEWAPQVLCVDGAAAGADEIVVRHGDYTVNQGQFISYDDWPYIVTWVLRSGLNTTVGIQTPLRRIVPAGSLVKLRATGLFRAVGDVMGNPSYDGSWHSRPQLQFTEWLGPERFA